MMQIDGSTILIVSNIDDTINQLSYSLSKHNIRIIRNQEESKDEFLMIHAQQAIKEAYLATANTKYILLCGATLRIEAQNSLLKVLEEPPKNIVFIIITLSKSSILPTIFSRISCQFLKKKENINEFMYNLNNLDLKDVYELTKNNMRITKNEAKEIIQSILNKAYKQNINLSPAQLDSFSMSLKLLHLNSRPINILTFVLLNFISNNKK